MRTSKRVRSERKGTDMPTVSLFANAAFDSDTAALLASAFDTAWDTLKKSGSPFAADGQSASTRQLLAKRIIATGRAGERNPQRLVEDALAHLAGSKQ